MPMDSSRHRKALSWNLQVINGSLGLRPSLITRGSYVHANVLIQNRMSLLQASQRTRWSSLSFPLCWRISCRYSRFSSSVFGTSKASGIPEEPDHLGDFICGARGIFRKTLHDRDPENMTNDELSELSQSCEIAHCNIDSYVVDRTNATPDYM